MAFVCLPGSFVVIISIRADYFNLTVCSVLVSMRIAHATCARLHNLCCCILSHPYMLKQWTNLIERQSIMILRKRKRVFNLDGEFRVFLFLILWFFDVIIVIISRVRFTQLAAIRNFGRLLKLYLFRRLLSTLRHSVYYFCVFGVLVIFSHSIPFSYTASKEWGIFFIYFSLYEFYLSINVNDNGELNGKCVSIWIYE